MNKSFSIVVLLMILLNSVYSKAQNLKIMSYNIRFDNPNDAENEWKHRKDFLTSQIQFYEPDIFGIQEALPNQVTDIATNLKEYNYFGIGRDGIGKGEASNIFYKKERFLVKDTNTIWLSETPDTISKGWDAMLNRICTYGLFKDLLTKKKFWLFNTHLDHQGHIAKTNSIQLILSKISFLNTKKYPVIFMGDFNTEPNENRIIELKKVMDDSRDVAEQKPFGPFGSFNNFKHDEGVTKLIDYIFISKNSNFKVKKHGVLSDSKDLKYASDHLPIYIELNYK